MNHETEEQRELEQLEAIRARKAAELGFSQDVQLPDFAGLFGAPDLNLTREQVEAEERRARYGEAAIVRGRLPPLFADPSLSQLVPRIKHPKYGPTKELVEFAGFWKPRMARNVIFLGETGVGKSTAAAVMFRRALLAGLQNGGQDWNIATRMHWFRAATLERSVREWPLGQGEAPAYTAAKNATIFFLDELGWEKDPKAMAEFVSDRYESRGYTVITSGFSKQELDARYGAAFVRRLLTQRARVIESWPSSPPEPRPPGDQEQQAARLGETL